MATRPFDLEDRLIVFRSDHQATAIPLSIAEFDDPDAKTVLGTVDFVDAASVHADHWEIHPDGDEILLVISGRLAVTVDRDGQPDDSLLEAGQALIVPKGHWHRLEVVQPGRLLFLTPGPGTDLRPHHPGVAPSSEGGVS